MCIYFFKGTSNSYLLSTVHTEERRKRGGFWECPGDCSERQAVSEVPNTLDSVKENRGEQVK